MDIKLSDPVSPKPTTPELMVKCSNYSRTKEEKRERYGQQYHQQHLRDITNAAFLDNKRCQDNIERSKKRQEEEQIEKGQELDDDLERGLEQHEKFIADISNKGKEEVEHSFKVVENLKHQNNQTNHLPQQ